MANSVHTPTLNPHPPARSPFSAAADDIKRALTSTPSLTLAKFPEGCEFDEDAEWKVFGLTRGYRLEYDEVKRELRLRHLGWTLIIR